MKYATSAYSLKAEFLEPLRDRALFYPCCGQDLDLPIWMFASALSDFHFVDINRPSCPDLRDIAEHIHTVTGSFESDTFVHRPSGHEFRVHRWKRRAEGVLDELPELGVFFFRGDYPNDGEGSSGIMWLGGELFPRVLALLVPGGLVVTDGSNSDTKGPLKFSEYFDDRKIRKKAVSKAQPFEYCGRRFECVGYAGEKYGPTLIWKVG